MLKKCRNQPSGCCSYQLTDCYSTLLSCPELSNDLEPTVHNTQKYWPHPGLRAGQKVSVEGKEWLSLMVCLCRLYILLQNGHNVINTNAIWALATLATPCMYTNTASSPLIPLLNQQYIFIVVCAACSLSLPPYPFTTLLTNTCHLCGSKHQSRSTLGLLHRYPWPFLLGLYQDASIGITYNTHYTCSALRGSSSHSQLCLQLLQLCSNLLHCL